MPAPSLSANSAATVTPQGQDQLQPVAADAFADLRQQPGDTFSVCDMRLASARVGVICRFKPASARRQCEAEQIVSRAGCSITLDRRRPAVEAKRTVLGKIRNGKNRSQVWD